MRRWLLALCLLVPAVGAAQGPVSVTAEWSNALDADTFELERDGTVYPCARLSAVSCRASVPTGTATWRARGVWGGVAEAWSEPVVATVGGSAPGVPTIRLHLFAQSEARVASVVQYTFSSNANAFETDATEAVSFAVSATVGNVIAVGIAASATNRTISSVSDEGGNTYTLVTGSNNEFASSGTEVWWYTAPVTTTAQTVTVVINSALATPARVVIVELNGSNTTTPVEDTAIADTIGTSHACGPITASGASVLLGLMFGSNGTYSNEASWTSMGSVTNGHAAYREVTAGDYTWTPTTSASEATAMSLIAIAPAAAAGGGRHAALCLVGCG